MRDSVDRRLPWWKRDPQRLDQEIAALTEADFGARFTEPRSYDEPFVVECETRLRGERLGVQVVYPADFPNGPPELFGDNHPRLPRHQLEQSGKLCVLRNEAAQWHPVMNAADLMAGLRDGLLVATEKGPEEVDAGEADIAEPVTAQLIGIPTSDPLEVIVPEPFWSVDVDATHGTAKFIAVSPWAQLPRMILTNVPGIGQAEEELVRPFTFDHDEILVKGAWAAIDDETALVKGDQAILDAIAGRDEELLRRLKKVSGKRKPDERRVPVLLLVSEQGGTKRDRRQSWAYVEAQSNDNGGYRIVPGSLRNAQALTEEQREVRIPALAGANRARVTAVGAGSVGSPLIAELAKGGVGHLNIYDPDVIEVNNAVRHLQPATASGTPKAFAAELDAMRRNPFGACRSKQYRVGSSISGDAEVFEAIRESDLVIDTTGSRRVARTLQSICVEGETPLLVAGLTSSSFGGEILKVENGGPCIDCFIAAQAADEELKPPKGPESNVTGVNCAQPTFFGNGFDATELATNAARLVFGELPNVEYEGPDWNLAILDFRSEDRLCFEEIAPQPECRACEGKGA